MPIGIHSFSPLKKNTVMLTATIGVVMHEGSQVQS